MNRSQSSALVPQTSTEPFVFPTTGQPIRVEMIDGESWFIAADVCAVIGLDNPTMAVKRLVEGDLITIEVSDVRNVPRQMNAVNESGLYDLILDSRKPEARAFRRWVTSEVLPSIRRTGAYAVPMTTAEMLVVQAQQLVDQERRVAAQEERTLTLEAKLSAIEGEHDYFTALAYAKRHGLCTEVAYLSRVGKRATKIAQETGQPMGSRPDARWSSVKTYPAAVLDLAFSEVKPK